MTDTTMNHLGSPCIHCGVLHDEVEPGPCSRAGGRAGAVRSIAYLDALIARIEKEAAAEVERAKACLAAERAKLNFIDTGLDIEKIALAEAVVSVGPYTGNGEQPSARDDAIKWFAGAFNGYRPDLRSEQFATKNYDRWSSQRCDCQYGYGPSHGYINFRIGLKRELRGRDGRELTDAEREAAIYYLTHIKAIQESAAAEEASS